MKIHKQSGLLYSQMHVWTIEVIDLKNFQKSTKFLQFYWVQRIPRTPINSNKWISKIPLLQKFYQWLPPQIDIQEFGIAWSKTVKFRVFFCYSDIEQSDIWRKNNNKKKKQRETSDRIQQAKAHILIDIYIPKKLINFIKKEHPRQLWLIYCSWGNLLKVIKCLPNLDTII